MKFRSATISRCLGSTNTWAAGTAEDTRFGSMIGPFTALGGIVSHAPPPQGNAEYC